MSILELYGPLAVLLIFICFILGSKWSQRSGRSGDHGIDEQDDIIDEPKGRGVI